MAIVETSASGGGGGGGSSTPLDWKNSVRVATTANITLSGEQPIDDIAVVAGDRVLVKNQTTGANNGIYTVAAGTWSRASDANTNALVTTGLFTYVEEGTVNQRTTYVLRTLNPITLGTTSLTFAAYPASSGAVTGSGSPGQIAYWNGASTLTGENNLLWNEAANQMTIIGDSDLIKLQSTGSTQGPQIRLEHTGALGNDWRIQSTGVADIGGGGAFLLHNFSTGVNPLYAAGATGYVGINNTNPSTNLDVSGNAIVSGLAAIGNQATFGIVSGAMRYVDVENTETSDFSAASSWRNFQTRFVVDPSANSTALASGFSAQVLIPDTNASDFHALIGGSTFVMHLGAGTLDLINGFGISVQHASDIGHTTLLQGVTIDAFNNSNSTVPNNVGIQVQTGDLAGGNVTDTKTVLVKTPHMVGTLHQHVGVYVEDQTTPNTESGKVSWAIYCAGERSYFRDSIGLNITAPKSLLHVNGSISVKRTEVDVGNYNVLTTDYIIGKIGITGGGDTIVLPDASVVGVGKTYVIKDESYSASVNNLIVAPSSGTIENVASYAINTDGGSITVYSDGLNWQIQ